MLVALDSLRANKLRSALTILGVVIGITAIVGMTSLIRGFDQSLRDSIRELGPNTIFVAKFSGLSIAAGGEFAELLRRPNLTVEDATAIEKLAPSAGIVDIWLGAGGPPTQTRVFYGNQRTKLLAVLGATENFVNINFLDVQAGRFFTEGEVLRRRNVVVLGQTPYQALFGASGVDPVGKRVRVGAVEYTVVGAVGKRPSAGGFDLGQDDFVVIPETTYRKQFGIQIFRQGNRPTRACSSRWHRAWTAPGRPCWRKSKRSCASATTSRSISRTTSTSSRRTRPSISGVKSARRRC